MPITPCTPITASNHRWVSRLALLTLAVCACLYCSVEPVAGRGLLTVQLAPAVAFAPAILQVRAMVETDDDNRSLLIALDSGDFYRSSQIPLEGQRAPRISVFQFRDLPAGVYDVTAVLQGSAGQRASVSTFLKVVPFGGR